MTASSSAFWNQNGPIISCFEMATQAVHFTECKGLWRTLSALQDTQLLQLTCPQSQMCVSSLNQTSSRKSGSSSILFSNHWHITEHFSMSDGGSLCLIWILYVYSWRSFFKILCNEAHERPSSWEHLPRDFFRLLPTESLSTSTLLGHLLVNFLPDMAFSAFLFRWFTDPVAWNLSTEQ